MKTKTNAEAKEDNAAHALKTLENKENLIRDVLKNPYVRVVLISATIYGVLYISRYFINATAETVRAVKNLGNALRE